MSQRTRQDISSLTRDRLHRSPLFVDEESIITGQFGKGTVPNSDGFRTEVADLEDTFIFFQDWWYKDRNCPRYYYKLGEVGETDLAGRGITHGHSHCKPHDRREVIFGLMNTLRGNHQARYRGGGGLNSFDNAGHSYLIHDSLFNHCAVVPSPFGGPDDYGFPSWDEHGLPIHIIPKLEVVNTEDQYRFDNLVALSHLETEGEVNPLIYNDYPFVPNNHPMFRYQIHSMVLANDDEDILPNHMTNQVPSAQRTPFRPIYQINLRDSDNPAVPSGAFIKSAQFILTASRQSPAWPTWGVTAEVYMLAEGSNKYCTWFNRDSTEDDRLPVKGGITFGNWYAESDLRGDRRGLTICNLPNPIDPNLLPKQT